MTTFCSSLLEHHFLAFLDSREARFLHSVLNIIPRFNFFSKLSKQVSVLWPTICLHQSNSPIALTPISFGWLKILAKIQISFESRFSWFHNAPHKIRQRCRVLALTFVPINFYRTVCFVHGMLDVTFNLRAKWFLSREQMKLLLVLLSISITRFKGLEMIIYVERKGFVWDSVQIASSGNWQAAQTNF